MNSLFWNKFKNIFVRQKLNKIPIRQYVQIRMHAIGGQGANSMGKILAETCAMNMGYTAHHFASFGSEKKGSPVQSFVRFSTQQQEIRTASAILKPDLLILFHPSMMDHEIHFAGAHDQTDILINSQQKLQDLHFFSQIHARNLFVVDAQKIMLHTGARLNSVMFGASLRILPEIDFQSALKNFKIFFKKLPSEILKNEVRAIELAYHSVQSKTYSPSEVVHAPETKHEMRLGWNQAPIGGVISNPANTIYKDLSSSRRTHMPRFYKEICFNCGFCDATCPDFCFVWKTDENQKPVLQGIDYQYCKACQKCIQACPVGALVRTPENQIPDTEKLTKLFTLDNYNDDRQK